MMMIIIVMIIVIIEIIVIVTAITKIKLIKEKKGVIRIGEWNNMISLFVRYSIIVHCTLMSVYSQIN